MSDDLVKKDNTSLTTRPKMPSFKKGIALNRQNAEEIISSVDPSTLPNRLGLVFDDSGSMGGEKLEHAKSAVKNFTLSCNFQDTSIAIYPLNKDNQPLTVDYDLLNLYTLGIHAEGGTPLYATLLKLITNESITRGVIFSDGSPTDSKLIGNSESWDSKPKEFAIGTIKRYTDKEIPIDTIYLGEARVGWSDQSEDANEVYASGYNEMKKIAEMTGGIFIHFKDSNSLSANLKYLAPKYRALLANAELKEKVERGEKI